MPSPRDDEKSREHGEHRTSHSSKHEHRSKHGYRDKSEHHSSRSGGGETKHRDKCEHRSSRNKDGESERRDKSEHRSSRNKGGKTKHRLKDGRIDKHKLRDIATKNATRLAIDGLLPRGTELMGTIKKSSINQLVDICKTLQNDENSTREASRRERKSYESCRQAVSRNRDQLDRAKRPREKRANRVDDDEFFLPDPIRQPVSSIKLNIPNANSFPVSSGWAHRYKKMEKSQKLEAEVGPTTIWPTIDLTFPPAAPTIDLTQPTAVPLIDLTEALATPAPPSTSVSSVVSAPSFARSEPWSVQGGGYWNIPSRCAHYMGFTPLQVYGYPPPPFMAMQQQPIPMSASGFKFPVSNGCGHQEILEKQCEYSERLSNRFSASDPLHILSREELRPDYPYLETWANKKNTLKDGAPLGRDNFGMRLLEKMGWQQGNGLGKLNQGVVEPVIPDLKFNRNGLSSKEEAQKGRGGAVLTSNGQNPISALTLYCQKKGIAQPMFTCTEVGTSKNKRFLWQAVFNGVEYQPSVSSPSKKEGKAQVALVVLQAIESGCARRSG